MKKTIFLSILLCGMLFSANAQLFINEILVANASVNYDRDYFNFPSWVEIYNSGGSAVNLQTYYLTDNKTINNKWIFPNVFVPAGGYTIVWCDKMNTGMHSNFSMDADGEFIGIYNNLGQPVDTFTYPAQRPNISYGRSPNGTATWKLFGKPTPESSNNTAVADAITTKPVFSIKGGFYSSAQSLVLSSVSPGAKIYYTKDGSEPADTSAEYSTPISITKNTVVRARAYQTGYAPSDIKTNTYLINETSTMTVACVTIPPGFLWNDTIGIYVKGENGVLFPIDGINNYDRSWERAGNVELFKPGDTAFINTYCGIEIQGGTSRGRPQKSLDIKIKDTYGQDKVKCNLFTNRKYNNIHSFFLRNSGNDWSDGGDGGGYGIMFRDGLIHTFPQGQMDVDYMSYRPANIFLNGQYWGIQNIREKMDRYYCNNNFESVDKDSVVIIKQVPEDDFEDVEGDTILLKKFIDWVRANDLSIETNFKKVRDSVDLREFINYIIVETYSNNIDWPHTGGGKMNNVKLWRQPGVTKWRWMLYDLDFGFNGFGYSWKSWEKNILNNAYSSESDNPNSTILLHSFMENTSFKKDFAQTNAAHLNTTYAKARVDKIIDSLEAKVQPEIQRHINKWGAQGSTKSMYYWNLHMQYTHAFTNQKMPFQWSQLKTLVGMSNMAPVKIKRTRAKMGMVYIHGATMYDSVMSGQYFNNIPIELKAVPNPGYYFIKWEIKKGGTARYSTNTLLFDTLNSTGSKDSIFYTAIFNSSTVDLFTLTVTKGTGSGTYPVGAKVTVNANKPPTGAVFDKWTGDVSGIADVYAASTTLTMTASSTGITATYKIGGISLDIPEITKIPELYPNPADDVLEIGLGKTMRGSLAVMDIAGKTVVEKEINTHYLSLDVSGLASGIYMIVIKTSDGIVTGKFIKK